MGVNLRFEVFSGVHSGCQPGQASLKWPAMKRVYTLLGLLSFAFATSSEAAPQNELYVTFYQMIQQADTLAGKNQEQAAVDLYRSARAGLQKLQQDNPNWNKGIVDFRLGYIADRLDPLDSRYPASKPAPKSAPKKNKKGPSPAVQTQLAAINDELIRERYRGIRPAPGYPACPDHTEKATLFQLLNATQTCGVELSESYAMYPASSVSGFYYSHPESRYFAVGKIGRDQVKDIATRKGEPVEVMERWLRPNLDY